LTDSPRKKSVNGLGHTLRMLRSSAGQTIGELSERSSVSRSTISDLESGRNKNPTSATLNRITSALGYSTQQVMELIPRYDQLAAETELKKAGPAPAASYPTAPVTTMGVIDFHQPTAVYGGDPDSAARAIAVLLSENPQIAGKLHQIAGLPALHRQMYLYHLNHWLGELLMQPNDMTPAEAPGDAAEG